MAVQIKDSLTPKAPLSIKFSLLMSLLISFILPIVLLSPLLILHWLGLPLANLDITADSFGGFVLTTQVAALVGSLLFIARKLKQQNKRWVSVGLRKFNSFQAARYIIGYYLIILGIMITLGIILSSLGTDMPEAQDGQAGGDRVLNLMGSFVFTFIATVVIAPIIEEIVFRGMLFPAIKQRYGLAAGVILSSLVFMLVHLDPINMISVLPLGIYLAIMYHRTNSIYPGIILHASWNLAVLLITQIS